MESNKKEKQTIRNLMTPVVKQEEPRAQAVGKDMEPNNNNNEANTVKEGVVLNGSPEHVSKKKNPKKKYKKVLQNKTYQNDQGYFVTKSEYVEVTDDEAEDAEQTKKRKTVGPTLVDMEIRLKHIHEILRGIQADATMGDEFPPVFYSMSPDTLKQLCDLSFVTKEESVLLHNVTKSVENVDGKEKANSENNIVANIQNMLGFGQIRCGFCATMSETLYSFAGDKICKICYNKVQPPAPPRIQFIASTPTDLEMGQVKGIGNENTNLKSMKNLL